MKVWYSYGSEHSANLVIIGRFKTAEKAEEIQRLIEGATEVATDDESAGRLEAGKVPTEFSEPMLNFLSTNNFHSFRYTDPEQLLYSYDLERSDDQIVVTTDEENIQAFIKMLLWGDAKVEVYCNTYPGPHGR